MYPIRILFLLFLGLPPLLQAQDLNEARRLAESGRHQAAEAIYQAALQKNPDNLEALIGAGHNYAWAGQHQQAQTKFEAALAIDPKNADALIGQGYNFAWSGSFAAAKTAFHTLERLEPGNAEARKGLGYVHLWQGNGKVAIEYFEKLVLEFPGEIEYYIALAQAYLLENELKKARLSLRSGLQIDSSNRTANELLKNTYGVAAPLELDLWGGYSNTADKGKLNLRTIQLTAQVSARLRMFAKFDNSLSLDLPSLVRMNQNAQSFSIGAVTPWNRKWTSRFEYGTRLLPDNVTQQIFSTEQVYFLSEKLSLKGGGFYAPSNKISTEWLAYGSLRVPVSRFYAIEPYYFYARVENAPGPESRFMLNNQLRTAGGYEINLGAFYGKAGVGPDVADDALYGCYATAVLPFSQVVWGQLSARWERAPVDDLLALGFGLKIRLEK